MQPILSFHEVYEYEAKSGLAEKVAADPRLTAFYEGRGK